LAHNPWWPLALAPGLGIAGIRQLLERFEDASAIVASSKAELIAAGISPESAHAIHNPDQVHLAALEAWLLHADHHLVPWSSDEYPPLLKEITRPPVALFVSGSVETLSLPQLAIVGSRKATPGGIDNARNFARYLASHGFCITSGLALGIDAAAHTGALAAKGKTIAVCGSGPDQIYPARHQELAASICETGALVSEFPPGTPPRSENFPQRNRIISGLSVGTLVVEAGLRSGALITARNAGEQGREVFAIPGSIHNPMSKGCHRLIRQGAKLVETAQDIGEELTGLLDEMRQHILFKPSSAVVEASPDPEYESLLEAMGWDPVSADLLLERTQLTADQVSSMLLILELDGKIKPLSGGLYQQREQGHPK